MPLTNRRDAVLRSIDKLLANPTFTDPSHRQHLHEIRDDAERAFEAQDLLQIASIGLRLSNFVTWIIDHLPP